MKEREEDIIRLADGTVLVPLDPKEKELLEKEVEVVMAKYSATFLPILIDKTSIAMKRTEASIALYKKIAAPTPNAEAKTAEETPGAEAEAAVAPVPVSEKPSEDAEKIV